MIKRKLIAAFFKLTDSWNGEIHNYLESKIQTEYQRNFPNRTEGVEEMIQKMRDFYYMRISNTANLLIAIAALLTACVSLIVSAIALWKC
jgi:hypothetical protein